MKAPPNQTPVQTQNIANQWQISSLWQQFFSEIYSTVAALRQSGTAAQRPTRGLWAGRPYFDTTLNKPIWYDGTQWVDASGNPA